jgi:protein-L-isoaspartate(D-aspartate) O-methyltransferase
LTTEAELKIIRRAYAKQVLAAMQVSDERVEDAFADIRREDFLGPGPWPILRYEHYVPTPSADPLYLYANVLVGIKPDRKLNNGEPSFHARAIAAASPATGEHAVHIGAGVGYYSAIMAHLVGPIGRVTAIEFDGELAARAKQNLSPWHNIEIIHGDGTIAPFDDADVIYVNAGVTKPLDIWLDRLNHNGRLIVPLSTDKGFHHDGPPVPMQKRGAVFCIQRQGDDYSAERVSAVAIIPCEGGRDPASEAALAEALEKGGAENVTRLYRHNKVPEEFCWLCAPGWSLAFE